MTIRSLSTVVKKWPDEGGLDAAARAWARQVADGCDTVERIGYFGSSFVGGDPGRTDLEILVIVSETRAPFPERSMKFPHPDLPVAAEMLVYSAEEWERMRSDDRRFAIAVENQAVWIYEKGTA